MLMSDASPRSTQVAFPLIAGVGLGMLFHAPYQVFTRALRRQDVAAGTSAFFLVRFTGATVGLVSFLSASPGTSAVVARSPQDFARPSRGPSSAASCPRRCLPASARPPFSNHLTCSICGATGQQSCAR